MYPTTKKNVTWGENDEIEINVFENLKKVNTKVEDSNNILFTIEENESIDKKIKNLENEIKEINIKLDKIINLLKQDK
jgi:pantothenate kinase